MRRVATAMTLLAILAVAAPAYAFWVECYVNETDGYIFCFADGTGSPGECDAACDSAVDSAMNDCFNLPPSEIQFCLNSAQDAFVDCNRKCIMIV